MSAQICEWVLSVPFELFNILNGNGDISSPNSRKLSHSDVQVLLLRMLHDIGKHVQPDINT